MDKGMSMSEKEFEEFLQKQIPITNDIILRVEKFTPSKVRLGVELKTNVNNRLLAFGGSINTVMSVCGWALVFSNIISHDADAHIVIQKSSIEYFQPIDSDFVVECELINNEKRERFFKTYKQLGKARLELQVVIKDHQEVMVRFRGLYVVFK
ncbi:MAG: YiiD C-terminal domain-containing protein [Clostridia bacterium]|nr:YiiD C-terminal domain-containing protein [Clostridia bacterium]